jgi:prepilin-type N-terminal cleavage/methylation domain-containing protein
MKERPGYTLLEVLVAMAIAVLLLGAVYSAIGYQVRHAQAGRDLIDQTTLARSILDRMANDVLAVASLSNPSRYRNQQQQQSASGSGGGAGMTGAGAGAGAGGANTGGAANAGSAGGASGGAGGASGTSGSTSTPGVAVTLPMGVMGNASELYLFVGRYPTEAWPANSNDQAPLSSDLRRITYWLAADGKSGLCRQEIKVVTSQDALNFTVPTDDNAQYVMAPEVHSVEFSYFDGTNWNDTWDSTMLGPDNVTPVGSPRAIAIKIGVPAPGDKSPEPKLKYHRQVVLISTANGPTYLANGQVNQGGLTTTGQSTTGSTTTGPGSPSPSGN